MLKKSVLKEVGKRFGRISNELAREVIELYEKLDGHEDHISGSLMTHLSTGLLSRIERELGGQKIGNVQFEVQAYKDSVENVIGADLGFILSFNQGGINVTKSYLVQSKVCSTRTRNGVSYYYSKKRRENENSNVLNQARTMLNYTSDSFFFLYTKDGIKVLPALAVRLNGERGIDTRNFFLKSFWLFMRDFFRCFIGDHMIGDKISSEEYLLQLKKKGELDQLIKIEATIDGKK